MILGFMGFLHLSLVDILDILMVALIIWFIYRWLRGSSAMNIFLAILILLVARVIVKALDMKMMSSLLGTVIDVGAIALIIIFQPEIRQFLNRLGRSAGIGKSGPGLLGKLLGRKEESMERRGINEIANACKEMSEQLTGALIVIPGQDTIDNIIDTGDRVDAIISKRLIENIFFKNSPLHDGAMIISRNRIVAARCTLPITDRSDIPASFGMRHKAAVGISERCDATVIVVSEQTGSISVFRGGGITRIDNINTLKLLLEGNDGNGQETGVKAGV